MMKLLKINQLYNRCDTTQFKFKTTAQLSTTNKILGQNRAIKSIQTALDIKHEGYNLFVMGESGTGKHTLVDKMLKEKAKSESAPYDWCYVNNFNDFNKPFALQLPNGMGIKLKKDMQSLIKLLQEKIPQTFKQKEYVQIKKELEEQTKQEQDKLFYKLKEEAKKEDIFINDTTSGIVISPLKEGKTLSAEEFQSLDISHREIIEKRIIDYKNRVDENSKLEMEISRTFIDQMKEVDRSFIEQTVAKAMKNIKQKYGMYDEVMTYLKEVQEDINDNFEDFTNEELPTSSNNLENLLTQNLSTTPSFEIYNVNVLVNNAQVKSAPIIYEYNPTYTNLFGRIEHVSQMGTVTTDFNLIKAGSLHQANGGYLIIDATALLMQPYAWEGLKRMLQTNQIHIETIEESMGLTSSVTLNPQSMPLHAKIVLVGSAFIYYLLYEQDDDFKKLFKMEADFSEKTVRSVETMHTYAQVLATILEKYHLLPLTKKAVGRIIEFASRLVDDAKSLSIDFSAITDLLQESNQVALKRGAKSIKNDDILQALKERKYRSERIKEEIYDQIKEGVIQIDTTSQKVGQINGLSVLDFSKFIFSMPVKISALSRVGKEGVVDIEREVNLGGDIHSKGVMILSSYLASQYSHDFSMSLTASLVFEQSYSLVEGDSASLAELYALLSSIANVPIKQNFAVTGSINQNGEVQAIGGVNEKIEGFFDVCKLKDKHFKAAVIIPYSNIKNLMLKEEVLSAVRSGQFKVYAIKHVNEGIKLLMGIEAGSRTSNGKFPKNSLNYKVEEKLIEFSNLSLGKVKK